MCYFQPTTTFSAKLTPSFGQKQAAPRLIWPKSHLSIVADCCRNTPTSKLVHKKSLKSFGWESCMAFHLNTPFTAKLSPKFGQNDQFWGYSGPNNMCIWLQRAAEAFQSLNWPTSNDHDNLDRNYIWYFKSTTTFLPSWPPILTKKRGAAQGLIWPKWHVHMVADCCRSNPESKLVHKQGL